MKTAIFLSLGFIIALNASADVVSKDQENHDLCLDAISQVSKVAYARGLAHAIATMDPQNAESLNNAKKIREKHAALLKEARFICSRNWTEGQL